MKPAIRAFSWAIYLFWIVLIFFTATVVYSAFQLGQNFGFGEPSTAVSGDVLTASMPFHINNVGLYDISGLNLTTIVWDHKGQLVSNSSTFAPVIPRGGNSSLTHNITLSISSMATQNLSYLLFTDSNLTVRTALRIDYAKVFQFEVSTNSTMPWGAPLSNLTVGSISLSATQVTVPVSFENHSPFNLTGAVRLEIVDNLNRVVGEGTTGIAVLALDNFSRSVSVPLSTSVTNARAVRLYFQTSVFSYGPVVISLA